MHPILELRKLSKRFIRREGEFYALREVNFEVMPEDVYGIIGHSGAGKSTLLRCMSSLEQPSSGTILFQKKDISHLKGSALRAFRQQTGMIFQHFHLFKSRTVAQNIAYPLEIIGMDPQEREARIDELLDWVDLKKHKHHFPSRLSGGQKQRVGIARALANRPSLLFCDEATSALDPITTRQILSLLLELKNSLRLTIVLITHEMDVIKQICNKVAVLEKGSIVEQGPVIEIFAEPQHPVTQKFIQHSSHELPPYLLREGRRLLRLKFRGQEAQQPLLSTMIRRCQVDANILLGWLDHLQGETLGSLVIELSGAQENIAAALRFLEESHVHYERIGPRQDLLRN